MKSRHKIIYLLLVLAALVIGLILIDRASNDYGYAKIVFQLPDTQKLDVTINNKPLNVTGLEATYKLHAGSKKLIVTKPNYRQFLTNFAIDRGQTVFIDIVMQSTAPQVSSVATKQVEAALNGFLPQGFSIQRATYFYSNTWVVATVEASGGNTAVLVAKYVGSNNSWETVLGPGTLFSPKDLDKLPSNVAIYMNQQGYILEDSPSL